MGKNRVSWEVISRSEGNHWRVLGTNLDNDVRIDLTYRVKNTSPNTSEFEHTLSYTMPDFRLVLANVLHFKAAIEQKSEQALQRLKTAAEQLPII
ncbi:MAG: putative membrane protein [Marinobacter maritimus]|jgi:uncharacterized membrane protein|uniref:hypothetical protein n=1 Tax=Marinobacter maritimus TaxID=277961 RepID=UPI000BCE4ADC|nr:hypothetical protein [Marinobacter maritimus]MBL1272125.1 hypothetical protein [Oceanospirillales bacterium]|tara:strand:+ start:830 stop:1114 length:285 start_codon:yes stop_codon:yes gene_type:complete